MTNLSNYFSIEELAKRWNLKTIDVLERIIKDKIPNKSDNLEDIYLEKQGFRRLRPISEVKKRPPEKQFVSKKDIEQYEKQHPELTKTLPDLIKHQYLFRREGREGRAWRIVFEGRHISGLMGKGFMFIHCLVLNTPRIVSLQDLIKLVGESVLPKTSYQETSDFKAASDYLRRIKEIQADITEAERNNDILRKEASQQEFERFSDLWENTKKAKQFNNETKKATGSIAKNIERAIKQIEIQDKPAAKHFKEAMTPLKTPHFSYRPRIPIPWDS